MAWTDFGEDGDELGVALARFTLKSTGLSEVARSRANQTVEFSQHNPDILWTGADYVVSWVDESRAESAPDIMVRRFDRDLMPLEDERLFARSSFSEQRPSLAMFGERWVLAWREGQADGTEIIRVSSDDQALEWRVELSAPGGAEDVPGLAALDVDHLLLVYTEGVNGRSNGLNDVPRMHGAVLSRMRTGLAEGFSINPLAFPYGERLDISQTRPAAATVGGLTYVGWTAGSAGDELAAEVFIKPVFFDPDAATSGSPGSGVDLLTVELSLPEPLELRSKDQLFPALQAVSAPILPGGAIAAAWDDHSFTESRSVLGGLAPRRDVRVTLLPSPLLRLGNGLVVCSTTEPCTLGQGHCQNDGQCASGLKCGRGLGPRFKFGRTINVCVPPHCTDQVQNSMETGVDCGGECGLCFECPPEPRGHDDHCSAICPCAVGDGDCDTDEQCELGARCGVDNGAGYGLLPDREVCELADCSDITVMPGETGYCVAGCPCNVGEGDCQHDGDCQPGLACLPGFGVRYGYSQQASVCLGSHCDNEMKDADETGVDCGGAECAPCGCASALPEPECQDNGEICDGCENGKVRKYLTMRNGTSYGIRYANTESINLTESTLEYWYRDDAYESDNRNLIHLGPFRVDHLGYSQQFSPGKRGMPQCVLETEGNYRFAAVGDQRPLPASAATTPQQLWGARALNDGHWHHVACVLQQVNVQGQLQNKVTMYIDGRVEVWTTIPGRAVIQYHSASKLAGINAFGPYGKTGAIDEVRLSNVARYTTDSFTPQRRFTPDCETAILWHLDGDGIDYSENGNHLFAPGAAPSSSFRSDDCYNNLFNPGLPPECTGTYARQWQAEKLLPTRTCTDPNPADPCDGCVSGEPRTVFRFREGSWMSLSYQDPAKINLDDSTLEFWMKLESMGTYPTSGKNLAAFGPFYINLYYLAQTNYRSRGYQPICVVDSGNPSGVLGVDWQLTGPGLSTTIPQVSDLQWHHIACQLKRIGNVYHLQAFVDGKSDGPVTLTKRPRLRIWAHDWTGININQSSKQVNALFDELRLSNVARYGGNTFIPSHRFSSDCGTAILLHFDGDTADSSGAGNHYHHPAFNWAATSGWLYPDQCHGTGSQSPRVAHPDVYQTDITPADPAIGALLPHPAIEPTLEAE
jgi:hypothetical protein